MLPTDQERRQYPRFPCASPIRLSSTNLSEHSITGACLEVCRNGLRIEISEVLQEQTKVSLEALSLGLAGRGVVRYCLRQNEKYIVGVEFTGGLEWQPPEQNASPTALSAGMTARTAAIFQELLGGSSAQELQPAIDELTDQERDILLCTAACIQSAVADTCQARAQEIAALLAHNSQRLPESLTPA